LDTWIDGHGIKRRISDVFVSYAREDQPRVNAVIEQLRKEGLTVFWDRDIPPGVDFGSFLDQALRSSRLVLVVWSTASINRDFVYAEAEFARSRSRLVSCRIDKCTPKLPFNTFQTADLSEWNGTDTHHSWRAIADVIRFRVTTGNATTPIGDS
jgi:TIR domain